MELERSPDPRDVLGDALTLLGLELEGFLSSCEQQQQHRVQDPGDRAHAGDPEADGDRAQPNRKLPPLDLEQELSVGEGRRHQSQAAQQAQDETQGEERLKPQQRVVRMSLAEALQYNGAVATRVYRLQVGFGFRKLSAQLGWAVEEVHAFILAGSLP
jgi:hypothetical protein